MNSKDKAQQYRTEAAANLQSATSWILVSTTASTACVQGSVEAGDDLSDATVVAEALLMAFLSLFPAIEDNPLEQIKVMLAAHRVITCRKYDTQPSNNIH